MGNVASAAELAAQAVVDPQKCESGACQKSQKSECPVQHGQGAGDVKVGGYPHHHSQGNVPSSKGECPANHVISISFSSSIIQLMCSCM